MANYKDTLNLPQTAFPMKANLANREPEILAHWQALDLYVQAGEKNKGKPSFVLHHGPAYANGPIHIGHALNMALKDFIVKSKRLSGYDAPFMPGWDCHGLPVELNVEKKIGRAGQKVSVKDFRLACRAYASQQIQVQREALERLGLLADFAHPYRTMDYTFEADIIRALASIVKKGYVQSGFKPVHWCLDCASALAEAEVEYHEKSSLAIDVRFRAEAVEHFAKKLGVMLADKPLSIPIWTTTPWTLPANEAVAVHPNIQYALIETDAEYLILAEDLASHVMQRTQQDHYEILHRFTGEALQGLRVHHPFYEKTVPLILGEHVTTEVGTGAVHTAPGHGEEDYQVGLQYDLPINNPVDGSGVYYEDTPIVGGMHIYKANSFILDLLQEKGALLHQEKIEHSYPHCWRHKTPVLFRATPQWFIKMDQHHLREKTAEAIKTVQWIPAAGENRIMHMIAGRPDWCISRQRTWGVPLCLFAHRQTGELHPNTDEIMLSIAKQVEVKGIQAWDDVDINAVLGPEAEAYEKVTDILDVWFDSGVTHEAVLKQRDAHTHPADLYLEGSDQHRGWFQTSLLTSVALNNAAPYRQVLTHGFVVDAKARKMSKSLGNVIAPDKLFKQLGADVVRLWISSADYRCDVTVSDEILRRTADSYRRIRNTVRFLLANLDGFQPETDQVPVADMVELDCWLLAKTKATQAIIIEAYDTYQFHHVHQALMQYCSITLGSFYLDVIKDRQYTCKGDSQARRSAQTAMYHALEALVRWLAPILSFTADEIWQYIPGKRVASVLLSEWYHELPEASHVDQAFWQRMIHLRDEVNKAIEALRQAGKLGSNLEAKVILFAEEAWYTQLARIQDELRFVLITSEAKVIKAKDEPLVNGLAIVVEAATAKKCERCWHRRDDVGLNEEFADLCLRCVSNIAGSGEVRHYA